MSDNLIREVLARYDEDFAANTWVVPGGKSRAIQHKCIERMVVRAGIWFEPPVMVRADPEMCVMIVTGHIGTKDGDRTEWSVGEAAPKNNKNAYPYSMAEKRGKDRVALKLIGLHGLLYSEEEADDFRERTQEPQRQAPAVVRSGPTDRDMANAAPWISEIEACESRADLGALFRTQEWLDGKANMTAEAQKLVQDALAKHPQYQQRAA